MRDRRAASAQAWPAGPGTGSSARGPGTGPGTAQPEIRVSRRLLRTGPSGSAPRLAPRRTHHAAARVRAGAALVVACQRSAVLRPAGRRAEEEHLRRQELAGEDVPLARGPPCARCPAGSAPHAAAPAPRTRGRSAPGWPAPDRPSARARHPSPTRAARYGVYCTKQDSTCLPGGAMSGSMVDWMAQSMYGCSLYQPYFASSKARSR